jgi:Fe-S-cluster containining protein
MDTTTLQNLKLAFFNDGYQLAETYLKEGINKRSVIELVRETYQYIDSFIEQFLEHCKSEKSNVDCKKGCAYCCHQSVFILPYEAYFLYKYLRIQGDKELYATLKEKVIAKDNITSTKKIQEVIKYNKPCPLLRDNICMVYEARPMACRLFLSMKVQSCITERNNPSDFSKYASLYEIPILAGRMVNEGIAAYLSEKELKHTEWFLESSLRLLLEDESVIEKWLEGEDPFLRREIKKDEWEYLKKFDSK